MSSQSQTPDVTNSNNVNITDTQQLQFEDNAFEFNLQSHPRDIISRWSYIPDSNPVFGDITPMSFENMFLQQHNGNVKDNECNEIHILKEKNKELEERVEELEDKYYNLEEEHSKIKSELENIGFEYGVLQVDFYNEKEKTRQLESLIVEKRLLNKRLENDIAEADRVNTKRHNRLLLRVEQRDKSIKSLAHHVSKYESELESMNMLCFICRAGIKTKTCPRCNECCCQECFHSMDRCPFCRYSP